MKAYWKACGILIATAGLFMAGCGTDTAAQPEAKAAAVTAQEKFPDFAAKDVTGRDVTSDIFAQKKITVVNIWGTFCPPCIGEMPELGEWAGNMPQNAQLIGIVCDVANEQDQDAIREAQKILREAKADFVNIVPNKDIAKYLETVEAIPTTIFVDSQGKIIGNAVVGADVPAYKKVVKDYLNE